jgi:hypothetical protein
MDSYLDRLHQELKKTMMSANLAGLEKRSDDKWTPAQILEHLYLTYHNTNKGIARCIEKGAPMGTLATWRHRVGTVLVLNLGYFPNGRKSPERAVPKGMSADEVSQMILPEIERMDAGFTTCERKFGSRAKILDHPVLGPLNVQQWRKFHWVHGLHHARQIRGRMVAA